MRIDQLFLNSFGAFQDVSVEFAPGLNLFFGENEDGKSTLIDGLLLSLLGAAANSDRRLRYAPLDGGAYGATVHVTLADGRNLRLERDLAPGGRDRIGIRAGDAWVIGKRSESLLRDLGLPSIDLARATAVISASEVVLAAKDDARTVSKAISARVTQDDRAITGQQALKRLHDRRVLLENKEHKALEEELRGLHREETELAAALATAGQLDVVRRQALERLHEARALADKYRPAIEAFDRMAKARLAHDEISRRHASVFADLRSIRQREEEIAGVEREMAPLLPAAVVLEEQSLAHYHQLAALVEARRQTAVQNEAAVVQLQGDLELLREKLAIYRRACFTVERQRELDRIDGAVGLAQKNLAEKEAALGKAKPPGVWSIAGLVAAALAALAGFGAGLAGLWPGWAAALLALTAGAMLLVRRSRWAERTRSLRVARSKAVTEVELARAALFTRSGGREPAAWQEEFNAAQRLAEEITTKETILEAKSGRTPQAEEEEAELAAILAAAGCASPVEYEARAAIWNRCRRRLEEAGLVRDSLLRGRDLREWEESELSLAREEAAAKAALTEAEAAAAGLDPVIIAGMREELATLDLPALERGAAAVETACLQHGRSAIKRDPWEIETGLALAESALAENERRSAAVRLAMDVLGQAVAEVQGNLVPRIEARAGTLFARLTGGRYSGLAITSGPEMLDVAPCRTGAALPSRILSSGTADQMYLALRLALTEALQGPEPLPLILDDPFLTFDRPRLRNAVALLLELSAGSQVILVTKDEILSELAAQAGVRVGRLPGNVFLPKEADNHSDEFPAER